MAVPWTRVNCMAPGTAVASWSGGPCYANLTLLQAAVTPPVLPAAIQERRKLLRAQCRRLFAAIVCTLVRVWTGTQRRQTGAANRANTAQTAQRRSPDRACRSCPGSWSRRASACRIDCRRSESGHTAWTGSRSRRSSASWRQGATAPSSVPGRRSGFRSTTGPVASRTWWRSECLVGVQVSARQDCGSPVSTCCRPRAPTGERKPVCRVKGAAIGRAPGRGADGIGESSWEHSAGRREPCTGI